MDVKSKRNIVIVGHAHSGKTSLVESLLYVSGRSTRKGDVMQGNTVSDYNDDERQRQISINSSVVNLDYKNHHIQIIDTPGYSDFIGEIVASIQVADAAIVVVDATNGVEVGTEDVWQRLEEMKIPRLVFINKIEKEGARVDATIKDIRDLLSPKVVEIDFNSADLIESVAESDDALLEKYLENGTLSPDETKSALRQAIFSAKVFPLFKGSALTDQGVKDLLEAVIAYLPSPVDRPAFEAKDPSTSDAKLIKPEEEGPFAGFIFRSMFDPHLGNVALMRILRGRLNANSDLFNVTTSTKEHIGNINYLHGKEHIPTNQASCGDIVALPKLKNTHVCDSLTDAQAKVVMPSISFPEPSISASVKPKTRADEEKITASLSRLCEEDHTFKVNRNAETKELIISGIGDLHLKIMLDRMKSRYNVDVELGVPKVSYRETITRKGRSRYKYKKQSGGRGQYGDVDLEIAPKEIEGNQYEFVNKIFGGAIPRNFVPSIEKGVKQSIVDGILAGFPIYNVEVTVLDGSYHEVDSSDIAFQIAAGHAMRDAFKLAGPILLEPIMEVTIVVSDEFIGQISGDINSRRGRIMGTEAKGKREAIKAIIPLSEMFSYATDLRSLTGGRGSYSMKLSHYEQTPMKIAEKVIAESNAAKEKEHSA